MLKHITVYLIASILIILLANQAYQAIQYIHYLFISIGNSINPFFKVIDLGNTSRNVCLLMLVPLTLTGIPALTYRLVKGKHMPWLLESTWIIWLILVLSLLLTRQVLV